MLDLDDVGKAASYPMDVLRALTPDQLDRLSFLGFPERHGYENLNLLFPQNARFGKLDPPASYLSSGARVLLRFLTPDQLDRLSIPLVEQK